MAVPPVAACRYPDIQMSHEVVGGGQVGPGESVTVAVSLERDSLEAGQVRGAHHPGKARNMREMWNSVVEECL